MIALLLSLILSSPMPMPHAPIPPVAPRVWQEVDFWLPDLSACQGNACAARAHLEWLRQQEWFDQGTPAAKVWLSWEPDAFWRINAWEAAQAYRTGQWSSPAMDDRDRNALRETLGEEAWWAGCMPSPVPPWRFLPR